MPIKIKYGEIRPASQRGECELDLSGTTFREFSPEQLEILKKVTKVK
ncbi:MAG: hypothetical protein H7A40_04080 [Chlamydiales bacterium]|nr:hypothetical protein [Chlamydiales bacterium]